MYARFSRCDNNKACLGPNKNKSKEKKKAKEKVSEKSDQRYEPPHMRKRKEKDCMTWMSRVNWVPSSAKELVRDSNLKEVTS